MLQEQEETGEKKKKEKREKKMVVPKGNNRGDYSEFRNKDIRYTIYFAYIIYYIFAGWAKKKGGKDRHRRRKREIALLSIPQYRHQVHNKYE